jgi:hypothetical protein
MTNAAWFLPGQQFIDAEQRYQTLFTQAIPHHSVESTFLVFTVQDYLDPIPPYTEQLNKDWAIACKRYGWAVKDTQGHKIPGWAAGRWAVDLGRPEPWAWLTANAYAPVGYQGIHWDDLSTVPQLDGVLGQISAIPWHSSAVGFMRSIAVGDAINGGKDFIVPRNTATCGTVKLEFPRFNAPWGARPGRETNDWRMWTFGRADFGPGIQGLVRAGKRAVCDVWLPESWTLTQANAHAEVMAATCLLFDGVDLMLHDNGPVWWKSPEWFPCCAWPEQLGAPMLKAACWKDGSWRRQYQHGTVIVDKDGTRGRVA